MFPKVLEVNQFSFLGSFRKKGIPEKICFKGYRYGFNSKEKDDKGEFGSKTYLDYGFRIHYFLSYRNLNKPFLFIFENLL